jgi:hypothetical protein
MSANGSSGAFRLWAIAECGEAIVATITAHMAQTDNSRSNIPFLRVPLRFVKQVFSCPSFLQASTLISINSACTALDYSDTG